jgi:hypothetical protein
MTPELSEQQRQAVREQPGTPVRVVDTTTQATYVLLAQADYDRVRALFEEDEFNPDELAPLADEVAAKEGWADPAMDAYDALAPRQKP